MSESRSRNEKAAVTIAACALVWVVGATALYKSGGLNTSGLLPSAGCLTALVGCSQIGCPAHVVRNRDRVALGCGLRVQRRARRRPGRHRPGSGLDHPGPHDSAEPMTEAEAGVYWSKRPFPWTPRVAQLWP